VPIFEKLAADVNLKVVAKSMLGPHYAMTLQLWHRRVLARQHDILAMGFSSHFVRMWRYYLFYCEAGFRTGRENLMQVVLTKG
jgi:cyclopropane-fatty-acyl-phospholipid synthase